MVVIPALAEPDAVATLTSVAAARRPDCDVEILLVVNAGEDASGPVRLANEQTLRDAGEWAGRQTGQVVHVLDCRDLPAAQSGVGLARKIGMDAALARLAASGKGRGIIVSLDADCRVAASYLEAIADFFRANHDAIGATIHFEHPLDETPPGLRSSIIDYELHLRCYRRGLLLAGSPYASYTVGSAMAVRSEIYAQEGGMNRRAAGEDFYFINKLLKRGYVGEINNTTVIPSARISDRVPFGTGAAQGRAQESSVTTYAPVVYQVIRKFRDSLSELACAGRPMPTDFQPFLEATAFERWLEKTRANVASAASLEAQLERWFDGFRTMKLIHWLSDQRHSRVPVADAAGTIISWAGHGVAEGPEAMLRQLRRLDLRCGE